MAEQVNSTDYLLENEDLEMQVSNFIRAEEILLPDCSVNVVVPGGSAKLVIPDSPAKLVVPESSANIMLPDCTVNVVVPDCTINVVVPECSEGSDIEIVQEKVIRPPAKAKRKRNSNPKRFKSDKLSSLITLPEPKADSFINVCGLRVHVKSLLQNEEIRKQLAPFIEEVVISDWSDASDIEEVDNNGHFNLPATNDKFKLKGLKKYKGPRSKPAPSNVAGDQELLAVSKVAGNQNLVAPTKVGQNQTFVAPSKVVQNKKLVAPSKPVQNQKFVAPSKVGRVQKLVAPSKVVQNQKLVAPSEVGHIQKLVAPTKVVQNQKLVAPSEVGHIQKLAAPTKVMQHHKFVAPSKVEHIKKLVATTKVGQNQNFVAPSKVGHVQKLVAPSKVVQNQKLAAPSEVGDIQKLVAPSNVGSESFIEVLIPEVPHSELLQKNMMVELPLTIENDLIKDAQATYVLEEQIELVTDSSDDEQSVRQNNDALNRIALAKKIDTNKIFNRKNAVRRKVIDSSKNVTVTETVVLDDDDDDDDAKLKENENNKDVYFDNNVPDTPLEESDDWYYLNMATEVNSTQTTVENNGLVIEEDLEADQSLPNQEVEGQETNIRKVKKKRRRRKPWSRRYFVRPRGSSSKVKLQGKIVKGGAKNVKSSVQNVNSETNVMSQELVNTAQPAVEENTNQSSASAVNGTDSSVAAADTAIAAAADTATDTVKAKSRARAKATDTDTAIATARATANLADSFISRVCPHCDKEHPADAPKKRKKPTCVDCGYELVHRCLVCSESFDKRENLRSHVMRSHFYADEALTCFKCRRVFANPDDVATHSKSCGLVPIFSCELCPFKSKYKHNLAAHIRDLHIVNNYGKSFECNNCGMRLKNRKELGKHVLRSCTQKTMHKCPECGYQSYDRSNVVVHIFQSHSSVHTKTNINRDSSKKSGESSVTQEETVFTDPNVVAPELQAVIKEEPKADSYDQMATELSKNNEGSPDLQESLMRIKLEHEVSWNNNVTYENKFLKKKNTIKPPVVDREEKQGNMRTRQKLSKLNAKRMFFGARRHLVKCSKCGKKYERIGSMKRHELTCSVNLEILECAMCSYVTQDKSVFQVHVTNHILGTVDTSMYEDNSANGPCSSLKAHCSMCKEDTTAVENQSSCEKCSGAIEYYWCSICQKRFTVYVLLREHVLLGLQGMQASRQQPGNDRCIKCGKAGFSSSCELKSHLAFNCGLEPRIMMPFVRLARYKMPVVSTEENVLSKETPFVLQAHCTKCRTTKTAFERYTECSRCESPLTYKCEICNKLSASYADLRRHVLNAHAIDSQQCTKCGEVFGHVCLLQEHEEFCDTEVQLIHCDRCNYKNSSEEKMALHIENEHPSKENYVAVSERSKECVTQPGENVEPAQETDEDSVENMILAMDTDTEVEENDKESAGGISQTADIDTKSKDNEMLETEMDTESTENIDRVDYSEQRVEDKSENPPVQRSSQAESMVVSNENESNEHIVNTKANIEKSSVDSMHAKSLKKKNGAVIEQVFNDIHLKLSKKTKCGPANKLKRYCLKCDKRKKYFEKIKMGMKELCRKCKMPLLYQCSDCNGICKSYQKMADHVRNRCQPPLRFYSISHKTHLRKILERRYAIFEAQQNILESLRSNEM